MTRLKFMNDFFAGRSQTANPFGHTPMEVEENVQDTPTENQNESQDPSMEIDDDIQHASMTLDDNIQQTEAPNQICIENTSQKPPISSTSNKVMLHNQTESNTKSHLYQSTPQPSTSRVTSSSTRTISKGKSKYTPQNMGLSNVPISQPRSVQSAPTPSMRYLDTTRESPLMN